MKNTAENNQEVFGVASNGHVQFRYHVCKNGQVGQVFYPLEWESEGIFDIKHLSYTNSEGTTVMLSFYCNALDLLYPLPSELVRKCAKLQTCCFYPCFSDRLHKNNGKSKRIIGEIEGIMGKKCEFKKIENIFEHNLSSPTGSSKV